MKTQQQHEVGFTASEQSRRTLFQIIPTLRPAGAERVVLHLLQYHDRSRYQPVCVCLGKPTGSHYEKLVRQMDIPLFFLNKGKWATFGLMRRLDSLFRQYRPTVVHMHLRGLTYTYPLLLKHRTPVCVYTVHSLAWHDRGTRLQKLMTTFAFRYRVGRVVPVAIAECVRESIQQLFHYPSPPLIPNGIPTDDYTPDAAQRTFFRHQHALEPGALVIVHVGRFTWLKNHELLIRAFARLKSSQPLYLLLVGDGELKPQAEQLVHALHLSDRVRFLGIRADVPSILNASDVFVLSSRWEGNPMSVMEAMAAGLPVVSTAVGGVPELVEEGQTGFLVPSEDETVLSGVLQRLVDDGALRRALGARAREVALARFDARVMTRAYEALYESILSNR